MSTGSTPAASATPHASWWSKAVGALITVGKKIKDAFGKVISEEPVIQSAISKIAPDIETFSNLVLPGSGTIEQHILQVYGYVAQVVADGGEAVNKVTVSTPVGEIDLDQQVVNDIKTFLPTIKSLLDPAASTTPAPPPTTRVPASTSSK